MPKKNPYDKTCTKRQTSYLEKLAETGGRSVRIDLNGEDLGLLDALVASGFAPTRAEAVRRLIRAAQSQGKSSIQG